MRNKIATFLALGALGCAAFLASGFHFSNSVNGVTEAPSVPFMMAVEMGWVDDVSSERKFGYVDDLGASWEVIAPMEATLDLPTSAQIIDITSTSVNDDADWDSGAITVQIIGLDSSFDSQSEIVSLDGLTVAKSANSYIRIQRCFVVTAGNGVASDTSNAGDISFYTTTDSDYVAMIPAGEGQTLQAIYTVPNGYTAHIRRVTVSAASNKVVDFRGRIRLNADDVTTPVSPFRTVFRHTGVSSPATFASEVFNPFPQKTDIVFEAQGASNPAAAVAWDIVLTEN